MSVLSQLQNIAAVSTHPDEVICAKKLIKYIGQVQAGNLSDSEKKVKLRAIMKSHIDSMKDANSQYETFWKQTVIFSNEINVSNLLS